jgi:hypothetical protein
MESWGCGSAFYVKYLEAADHAPLTYNEGLCDYQSASHRECGPQSEKLDLTLRDQDKVCRYCFATADLSITTLTFLRSQYRKPSSSNEVMTKDGDR